MDGFKNAEKVIVIAASNLPESLDPAILRPGRFDRKITLSLPSLAERTDLIKYYLSKSSTLNHSSGFNIEGLANQTIGFSPAEISNLMNYIFIGSFQKNLKKITDEIVQTAFERVTVGVRRKVMLHDDFEKMMVANRMASMALIAHNRENLVDFLYLSILPNKNINGQISGVGVSERIFESKKEILATIDFYLAGRMFEKVYYKDSNKYQTGTAEYLNQATNLAYLYVEVFGLTNKNLNFIEISSMSQKIRYDVDTEVNKIIQERSSIIEKEISNNMKKISKLAVKLQEKEIMTKKEALKVFKRF